MDQHGVKAADHNLKPIAQMTSPSCVKELRRVIGLLVQHKDSIPRFKIITKPLFKLTGKVPWEWTDVHEAAFEELRAAALANIVLAAPDFTQRFYVDTDASDDGWGYSIYQLRDPDAKDEPINRKVIKYASGALWELRFRQARWHLNVCNELTLVYVGS